LIDDPLPFLVSESIFILQTNLNDVKNPSSDFCGLKPLLMTLRWVSEMLFDYERQKEGFAEGT